MNIFDNHVQEIEDSEKIEEIRFSNIGLAEKSILRIFAVQSLESLYLTKNVYVIT